jgi:hypothetical protein
VMMHASHKERADRPLRQARGIDHHGGPPPSLSALAEQLGHRLADRAVEDLVVQTLKKATQSREIEYAHQSQVLAQLAVFGQPHFVFAKSPILVAHQTGDGQQLRPRELVFAETISVAREHRRRDLQGKVSKRQESDFGYGTSCLPSKQQILSLGHREFSWWSRGCQSSQVIP